MNEKRAEKTRKPLAKSFMAVGPTLHYSHANVQRCWLLSAAAFALTCLFWSKTLTGSFWSFTLDAVWPPSAWCLDRAALAGISIFEYPWQILVLGLLMGIIAVVPVLVSQLLSFSYSVPFILAVFFLADLPAFSLGLLISAVAVACRPLRFRSRFVAVVLCTAPQLLYWGFLGRARGVEPIKWGFSFTPWVCAWIIGLSIAGLVLGIGHYTRYRPGLIWIFTSVFLFLAVLTFETRIGFDELDYQLYVAKNNPENVTEFHDHVVTDTLDAQIRNPSDRLNRHVENRFYPTDSIQLRAKLKEEIIHTQLTLGRWPWWFEVPAELDYQTKRQNLLQQYDLFITERSKSHRMPIALHYRALLSEYSPDIQMLAQKEVLHFYSDYPFERAQDMWEWLYAEFPDSPESLEARWRIAKYRAGRGRFEQAEKIIAEARAMLTDRLRLLQEPPVAADTLFSPFHPPPDSAMTAVKLTELHRRLNHLLNLISPQNRTEEAASADRLARYVMLNPHSRYYPRRLEALLEQMGEDDPLRDNIMLAQTKMIRDEQLRAEKLGGLHKEYQDTDGGMEALYELALLKTRQWRQLDDSNQEKKKESLIDARATLISFLSLYPKSFFAEQVQKNLDGLPRVD